MGSGEHGGVRWHRGGWEVRVQVGGQRVTKRVRAPNTRAGRRAAEAVLDQMAAASETMTLGQVLDRYAALKSRSWAPSTVATFGPHTAHIRAELGTVEVSRLRRGDLEDVYAEWLEEGTAPATVRRRHNVVRAALRQAERWGVLAVSPARDVEIDGVAGGPPPDLPPMSGVLEAVTRLAHQRLAVAAWLALTTGARRGELVALRWQDVEGGVARFGGAMSIGLDGGAHRKGTKSGKPKVVGLDPATVDVLGEWGRVVAVEAAAVGFVVSGASPVLPAPTDPSVHWHPGQVSLAWRRHRSTVGLDVMRFHDLRHLHITHLIGEGVPVPAVSGRSGHSSRAMTLDVYGHARPADDAAAVAVIGAASAGVRAGWVVRETK